MAATRIGKDEKESLKTTVRALGVEAYAWFLEIRNRRTKAGWLVSDAWRSAYRQVVEGVLPEVGCECAWDAERHRESMGCDPSGLVRRARGEGLAASRSGGVESRGVLRDGSADRAALECLSEDLPPTHGGPSGLSRVDDEFDVQAVAESPDSARLDSLSATGATYPDMVEWVAKNIDNENVVRSDAPNQQAWGQLMWARSSPTQLSQFWTRIYHSVSGGDTGRSGLTDDDRKIDELVVRRLLAIGADPDARPKLRKDHRMVETPATTESLYDDVDAHLPAGMTSG